MPLPTPQHSPEEVEQYQDELIHYGIEQVMRHVEAKSNNEFLLNSGPATEYFKLVFGLLANSAALTLANYLTTITDTIHQLDVNTKSNLDFRVNLIEFMHQTIKEFAPNHKIILDNVALSEELLETKFGV